MNGAATCGAHLAPKQLPRLTEITTATEVGQFWVFYDRGAAGQGQAQAVVLVNGSGGLSADGFDWEQTFPSPVRGSVKIPATLTDPGEFSGEQLRFLRARAMI